MIAAARANLAELLPTFELARACLLKCLSREAEAESILQRLSNITGSRNTGDLLELVPHRRRAEVRDVRVAVRPL